MKGYAIRDKRGGIGFDLYGHFLKSFLSVDDPLHAFLFPKKEEPIIQKEEENVVPTPSC